ncbi:MAG: DUF2934 domain-containing protein [Verrucomicrobiales bacterium]|nr:DUF2934 domain-containing protein [Verrucomicrobiales bacterium]
MNKVSPSSSSPSANLSTKAIAGLAYQYYLEEQCPDGRALDHWLRAEKALTQEARSGPKDPNGVPLADLSRWVEEGGTVISAMPESPHKLSPSQVRTIEQPTTSPSSPRQFAQTQQRRRHRR